MDNKRTFAFGMATAFGVTLAVHIYSDSQRRKLQNEMSAEILAILEAKNEDRATPEQMAEYAAWIAEDLVLHGFKSLAEYKEIDKEIDELLLHYHGHPAEITFIADSDRSEETEPEPNENAVEAEVVAEQADNNNNVSDGEYGL